jgi:hypothetical protein
MYSNPVNAAGHPCGAVTLPGYHAGRAPRNKGRRSPADPPTGEEIIAVMRTAGTHNDGVDWPLAVQPSAGRMVNGSPPS